MCNVFTPVCDFVHGGLSLGAGLCPKGGLCPGGLSPGRISVQREVFVRGGLCLGGVSVQGVSVQEVSVSETPLLPYATLFNYYFNFLCKMLCFVEL